MLSGKEVKMKMDKLQKKILIILAFIMSYNTDRNFASYVF